MMGREIKLQYKMTLIENVNEGRRKNEQVMASVSVARLLVKPNLYTAASPAPRWCLTFTNDKGC